MEPFGAVVRDGRAHVSVEPPEDLLEDGPPSEHAGHPRLEEKTASYEVAEKDRSASFRMMDFVTGIDVIAERRQ